MDPSSGHIFGSNTDAVFTGSTHTSAPAPAINSCQRWLQLASSLDRSDIDRFWQLLSEYAKLTYK